LAIAKEMGAKRYDLLSWVQVRVDGCSFFIQSAYLNGLE